MTGLQEMARAFRGQFGRRSSVNLWPTDEEGPLDVLLTHDNTEDLLARWQRFSEAQATDATVEGRLKAIQDEHDAMVGIRAGVSLAWCRCRSTVILTRGWWLRVGLVPCAGPGVEGAVHAAGEPCAPPQHERGYVALSVRGTWCGN